MSLEYTIVHSRRASISIVINRDGNVIVKAPLNARKSYIDEIIRQKSAYIIKNRDLVLKKRAIYPKKECVDGEVFNYLGEKYLLCMDKNQKKIELFNGKMLAPLKDRELLKKTIIKWYKNEAKEIFTNRLQYYSSKSGINYTTLRITSAKGRWGSCGVDGNINLNWKMVMLSMELIDAVVVHELSHIRFHNHSRDYYKIVREILPNYNELNRELKKSSAVLDDLFK